MVFASATLAATACAHEQKTTDGAQSETRHAGGGGCAPRDPAKVKELEAQQAELAKQPDSNEKAAKEVKLYEQLREARMPNCAPYGAPPARRRVV
jgi:hypothetical protein